jgi:peroxiredoxin
MTMLRRAARLPRLSAVLLVLSTSIVVAACSNGDSSAVGAADEPSEPSAESPGAAGTGSAGSPEAASATAPVVHAEGEKAARSPHERPLPSFDGTTLDGEHLAIRDLLGARIVLFFFNPELSPAGAIADAVSAIQAEAADANLHVVGVGVGSETDRLRAFADERGLDFPVIDDSSGTISGRLGLRSPNVVLGVDPDGYVSFGIGSFPDVDDTAAIVEADLRERLRLPAAKAAPGALFAWPKAPALGVVAMDSGDVLETSDLAGRAAIVIFFLHTCPHCHHALASIRETLESMPEAQRPRLVAISVQNRPSAIRQALKQQGLDYFEPYLDPDQTAAERWGVTGGVPVVLILDREGRIRHRGVGWDDARDPAIVRMKLARAAGAKVPMLLDPKGYSGNDVCGVCHEQEYATWQFTSHATAYDTLVTHAADRRTDCVGCHVVGFEKTGGFDFRRKPSYLENVGCESCHGRGGPHLSPGFVPKTDAGVPRYEAICTTCHNPTHSLGFDYATFAPRISHARIASLSDAERAALVEGVGPSRDLLPTQADYVGSDACQSCHAAEFATWASSPHGHALASLEKKGHADDPACLECHTTAFDKPGGFVPSQPASAQADLARVGCESCHGPGGDHVGENAKRVGTIVSLGDKCDSCVILKICGSCHDDDNDAGFQFRVEERIEAQRHGTIEPSATRGEENAPGDGESADRARLHEAFERLAAVRRSADPS